MVTPNKVIKMMNSQALTLLCILFVIELLSYCCAQRFAEQKCSNYVEDRIALTRSRVDDRSEFSYMVALGYGTNKCPHWLCDGTLISERFVLTAAHCTHNPDRGVVKMVHFGNPISSSTNRGAKIEQIARIIRHPNYKPPSLYHDIALLELEKRVRLSKSIFPACLNSVFDVRPRTNKLIKTSWDYVSDDMELINLELYSHNHCQEKYREVSRKKLAYGVLEDRQICAGDKYGENKCQINSGGPLIMKVGQMFSVVGVTSFDRECTASNAPGVFTRISYYVPWIENFVWE